MAAKRKTLPKNFEELLAAGDLDALKKVYDHCRIDARGGPCKDVAIKFLDCPDDLTRWLVAQGLDVDTPDSQGSAPLAFKCLHDEDVSLLLELGANVNAADRNGRTALHEAVPRSPRNVRILLDHGADMTALETSSFDGRGRTPLQAALERCSSSEVVDLAESARILLDAGSPVPANAAESVTAIGQRVQALLDRWPEDDNCDIIGARDNLYAMFGGTPVVPVQKHDGISPISVTATVWQTQFNELWDFLVPATGAATTMQGEVMRLAGRISHELLDNGGVNWDREFARMKTALIAYLGSKTSVTGTEELAAISAGLRADFDDHAVHRVNELAVAWVLSNPNPEPLPTPLKYNR